MPSVFRARNGAGFWGTSIGGSAYGGSIPIPAAKVPAPRRRAAPKLVGQIVGTQKFERRRLQSSKWRQHVIDLLTEYEFGLTAADIADEIGASAGAVQGILRTLIGRGMVTYTGRVIPATCGRAAIQYKLGRPPKAPPAA